MKRKTALGVVLLAGLALGCGSSSNGASAPAGPELMLGETDAVDGAGSPASWLLLDEPLIVRDFALGGATLAVVGSLYDRDFVFGGMTYANAGGSDGLLATLTDAGEAGLGWSFGGAKADEALAVAVRPSGNLIIGGFFRESVDLGGGALTDLRVKPGFSDPYFDFDTGALLVFELDTEGALVWSRVITSESGEGAVSAVALAENGDAIVAGTALGELDFGDGPSTGDGIFLARLGPDGASVSSFRFEGPAARVSSLAVDADAVIVAGYYQGALDLGAGSIGETGPDDDGFVARIDDSGALGWALRFGGVSDDRVASVALTDDGAAVVAGSFSRTLDLAEPVERERETGFAARIAASGGVDWVRAFDGSGTSRAVSVVTDGENVIVGGGYRDGVDLGAGELPADTDDGFVTGMAASDGAHLFSRRIARFNFGGLTGLDSKLFVTGTCEGVCALGGQVVPPEANGRLLVAELSTDLETHLARWSEPAELYVEGVTHAIVSAIALPGSAPENPAGITLVLSAAELGCSARAQLPRNVAQGGARRPDPELALLLTSGELGWHDVTSWLSADGGGSGGSTLAFVESISDTEIHAYVEHHDEATGSSATASYVMGKVTFQRCF